MLSPQRRLPTLDTGVTGFFPYLESVYDGGGLTLGAGYRVFYGPRAEWDIKGLYSVRHYKFVEASTTSAGHASGRIILRARAGWRDAPQVGFYGIGMTTFEEGRANFRLQQAFAGGSVIWRPVAQVVVAGAADVEDFTMGEGRGDAPPLEFVYRPQATPGLGTGPEYVHAVVTGSYDTRDGPGVSTKGGYVGASLHTYSGLAGADGFGRLDLHALQHLKVHDWLIVSARGRLQSTLGDGGAVPYFLLPSVGSGSSLRAYASQRFRDLHTVLGTAEGRWLVREWTIRRNDVGLEIAAFYDIGQVADEPGNLFDALEDDFGVGARLHWRNTTPARVDLAKGSEGWRVVFSGVAPF